MIYRIALALRHLCYDKGWKKSTSTAVPSVCVGNVALGGTGKTPMVELILRTLTEDAYDTDPELLAEGFACGLFDTPKLSISVLSRGYGRKTKGFLEVTTDGSADSFGDEPLQIKRNFPQISVYVDENRVEGCDRIADTSDIVILDDAYQHRRIRATKNILLTTYARPFFKDHLVPFGRLRDLASRAHAADMIVVTKCPEYVSDIERAEWAKSIGLSSFDSQTCCGVNAAGKKQYLLFATMASDALRPVFPQGNPRYVHSKLAFPFSGIADDKLFLAGIREKYKLVGVRKYPDHHNFTPTDLADIEGVASSFHTAVVVTTQKDAQRLWICQDKLSEDIKTRLFYVPIRTVMLTPVEQTVFKNFLKAIVN